MTDITTGPQTRTTAGTFTGSVTLGATPLTVFCDLVALTAGKKARVVLEDSAIGDFTDAEPVAVFHFASTGTNGPEIAESRMPREIQTVGLSGKIRARLAAIDADASITIHAYQS